MNPVNNDKDEIANFMRDISGLISEKGINCYYCKNKVGKILVLKIKQEMRQVCINCYIGLSFRN